MLDITAIVVNYRTPHLLSIVVDSFREHYPTVPLILVDNGSKDGSVRKIQEFQKEYRNVGSLLLNHNIYHGPAVNRALEGVRSSYFFLLDTDCTVKRGGFLEKMLGCFHNRRVYAVGKVRYVQESGVPVHPKRQRRRDGIPYAETWGALFDREKTALLGKFSRGGASGNKIASAAHKRRYRVHDFPMDRYIDHLGAGTRRMFNMSALPKPRQKASKWSKGKRKF